MPSLSTLATASGSMPGLAILLQPVPCCALNSHSPGYKALTYTYLSTWQYQLDMLLWESPPQMDPSCYSQLFPAQFAESPLLAKP